MTDKKKIAAIAAVTRYIQSEQEQQQVMFQAQRIPEAEKCHEASVPSMPPPVFNIWGAGGRGQQMQMRCLMQMKSFHRSKPMA
jgi:hypothetical protein